MGAPTWITWSTPPQSMPRSSEEVATTARSDPAAIAASTRKRCASSRLPWWMAIGRVSSLSRHSSWNSNSDWARVLTNTMVMPAARMRSSTVGALNRPMWPDHGSRPSGRIMPILGAAPPLASTSVTPPAWPLRET